MRWLVGSVGDWKSIYEQAYRALRPGGWIESYEGAAILESDDGSVPDDSAMAQWGKIFINFGETIGRPFTVVADGTQRKEMSAAGFVDIEETDMKVRRYTRAPNFDLFASRLTFHLDPGWHLAQGPKAEGDWRIRPGGHCVRL